MEATLENSETFKRGVATRQEVMGDHYVDSVTVDRSDISYDLESMVNEFAWGSVWSRDTLDRRARSIATLSILIAMNRQDEMKAHISGAYNNGLSTVEIAEIIIQAAVYCGFPAALGAMKILKEALRVVEPQNMDISGKPGNRVNLRSAIARALKLADAQDEDLIAIYLTDALGLADA